ncbi:MAG TPA: serine/threonine-protein kinase [Blastocatellia bacterium]|nr:serine/threonine-protein kinase [Blastocatellia bacterium]
MTRGMAPQSALYPLHREDADEQKELAEALTGRFQIVRLLWAGPHSSLYLVRSTAPGPRDGPVYQLRQLKVLSKSASSDADLLKLFKVEAQAACKLDHWNIVRTREAEQINGRHVVQTEPIENCSTLRDLLKRHAWLEPRRAIGIAVQAAGAVAYAHASGVLHLNLIPENILLGPDGTVLLSGFGIHAAQEFAWAHRARSVLPSQYMSPEQTVGSPVDYRSDIYTLGAIFFEMLTDRVPFDPDSKPIAEMPLPPRLLLPSIPEQLSHLVGSLLAPDPGRRISSVDELRARLVDMLRPVASATGIEPAFEADSRAEPTEAVLAEPDPIEIDLDDELLPASSPSIETVKAEADVAGEENLALSGLAPSESEANEAPVLRTQELTAEVTPAIPDNEPPEFRDREAPALPDSTPPAGDFLEPASRIDQAGKLIEAAEIEARRRQRVALLVLIAIVIAAILIIGLLILGGRPGPLGIAAAGRNQAGAGSAEAGNAEVSEANTAPPESSSGISEGSATSEASTGTSEASSVTSETTAGTSDASRSTAETATATSEESTGTSEATTGASETPPATSETIAGASESSSASDAVDSPAPQTESPSVSNPSPPPARAASRAPASRTYGAARVAPASMRHYTSGKATRKGQRRRRADPMRHLRDVKKFFYW